MKGSLSTSKLSYTFYGAPDEDISKSKVESAHLSDDRFLVAYCLMSIPNYRMAITSTQGKEPLVPT